VVGMSARQEDIIIILQPLVRIRYEGEERKPLCTPFFLQTLDGTFRARDQAGKMHSSNLNEDQVLPMSHISVDSLAGVERIRRSCPYRRKPGLGD
jgi:hypothetical protein